MREGWRLPAAQAWGGAMFLLLLIASQFAPARSADAAEFGGFGPEGSRMREQLWLVPSGEPGRSLRATVFRPESSSDTNRLPLVVINHGTDEATRLAVSMPVYYWLSRWFVERGYVVVLPQRRGHGATGGPLSESIGTCNQPDHYASGVVAADDIAATVKFMTAQSFVAHEGAIVVGVSTGGWASLALGARNMPEVEAIVNFAGGRGGHAYGQANAVCGAQDLVIAAGAYGSKARVPTDWYYAKNDSYFGPALANEMAHSWRASGGLVEEHILPAYSTDGHTIADDRAGWDIWGPSLDAFLSRVHGKAATVAADETLSPPQVEASTLQASK